MQNKEIVQRYIEEVFNKGNLAVVDELVSPAIADHNPAPGQAPGTTGVKEFARTYRNAFPDLNVRIEDMIAEGDRVCMRGTISGTQQGMFMNVPPTGKKVAWQAIAVYRLAGGQIV